MFGSMPSKITAVAAFCMLYRVWIYVVFLWCTQDTLPQSFVWVLLWVIAIGNISNNLFILVIAILVMFWISISDSKNKVYRKVYIIDQVHPSPLQDFRLNVLYWTLNATLCVDLSTCNLSANYNWISQRHVLLYKWAPGDSNVDKPPLCGVDLCGSRLAVNGNNRLQGLEVSWYWCYSILTSRKIVLA